MLPVPRCESAAPTEKTNAMFEMARNVNQRMFFAFPLQGGATRQYSRRRVVRRLAFTPICAVIPRCYTATMCGNSAGTLWELRGTLWELHATNTPETPRRWVCVICMFVNRDRPVIDGKEPKGCIPRAVFFGLSALPTEGNAQPRARG